MSEEIEDRLSGIEDQLWSIEEKVDRFYRDFHWIFWMAIIGLIINDIF